MDVTGLLVAVLLVAATAVVMCWPFLLADTIVAELFVAVIVGMGDTVLSDGILVPLDENQK